MHCHARDKQRIFEKDDKLSQEWKLPHAVPTDSRWGREFGTSHLNFQKMRVAKSLCMRVHGKLFNDLHQQKGLKLAAPRKVSYWRVQITETSRAARPPLSQLGR